MRTALRYVGPIAALCLLGLAVGCSNDSAAPSGGGSATTRPAAAGATGTTAPAGGGTLYVVTAGGGQLTADTLTLTGVDTEVTSFSDRPARTTSTEPLTTLVDGWAGNGFDTDPPNAALVTGGDSGHRTTVLELGRPTVSGTTVTFPVTPIGPGAADGALAAVPSVDQQGALQSSALFIDAGSTSTVLAWSITGDWGVGLSSITFDNWTGIGIQLPVGALTWQMGQAAVTQFTSNPSSFAALVNPPQGQSPAPMQGTVFGYGTVSGTALQGSATLPAGTSLSITVCGSGGPTTPLSGGTFSIPVPTSC